VAALHDVNVEFDYYMYKLSGNVRLKEMLEEFLLLTMRVRIIALRVPDRLEKIKDEHKKILRAMIEGETRVVERLVRRRIRRSSS